MESPQYFSDLASADFYLFSWYKPDLQVERYCDATDTIQNANEDLKRLPYIGFQECFQHVYSHWQKWLITQGDYFNGNVG
jgi:hypothetical protein